MVNKRVLKKYRGGVRRHEKSGSSRIGEPPKPLSQHPPKLSDRSLIWRQVRYQNKLFWRSPVAAFFTLAFPLMFLVVFALLFGSEEIGNSGLTAAQFYAPALAVFGAVSATFTNLAIGTAIARDDGILKRMRGTPLPPWIYMAGRVGSAVYLAVISVLIMLGMGVAFYGLTVFPRAVPALVVIFLVGAACFAALGLLIASLAANGESAPALANATLLPLAFISDIFIVPSRGTPEWVSTVADIFPLRHFATSFVDGFEPAFVAGHGSWLGFFHWPDIAVMLFWLVGGTILTVRWFSWEPRGAEGRRRRRRVAMTG